MFRFKHLPSVDYRNNTSSILGNVLEDRLREIKVVVRRITPASRRAKVSGSDNDGATQAPLRVISAHNLKASSTT